MTIRQFILIIVITNVTNSIYAQTERECIGSALLYEAASEPLDGQKAVLEVIENRAKAYNMTVCQVVKQKGQFTWHPSKPIKKYNKEMKELLTIIKNHPRILRDEMFFFRKELHPKWARKMKCRVIANHKFCRIRRNNASGKS